MTARRAELVRIVARALYAEFPGHGGAHCNELAEAALAALEAAGAWPQEDALVEAQKLAHDWMVKHDKLLGFIQRHPDMLAKLIKEPPHD